MKLDQFVGCALIMWVVDGSIPTSSVPREWTHERLTHILKAFPSL